MAIDTMTIEIHVMCQLNGLSGFRQTLEKFEKLIANKQGTGVEIEVEFGIVS